MRWQRKVLSFQKYGRMKKKSISGVVTDTNDEPLIGATVLVKGTQNGTVTDVEGRFHLKVNSGETLVVS